MFRGGEDFCIKVENNRIIKEEAETKLVTSTSKLLNQQKKTPGI